jgi:arginyl-tRNA synthetase
MIIVKKIQQSIKNALAEIGINYEGDIQLEHPRDLSHGDFSTNIAMILAKSEGKNPQELANLIVEKITSKIRIPMSIKIHYGFINIKIKKSFFADEVKTILKFGDLYGHSDSWKGKKILVEHSSPNIFKPFHIGHMMNNTIGESIARLSISTGADVTMISYPSDVSLGIGKAVWQLLDYGVDQIGTLETIDEKIKFLGKCYTDGTNAMKHRPEIEARIREITLDIYAKNDTEAYQVYCVGRDLNLEYFKNMTNRLGSIFDGYIFESQAGIVGKKIVIENTPNVYTESKGATIFEPSKIDLENDKSLHTRVFINKDGNPTYEAKDTGLLKLKFDTYTPDLSVFVTDHQQGPYFNVVATAAGKINPDWKKKTIHKTHGRMAFKGEKMSSRLGNTPIISDILELVNEEVYTRAEQRVLTESEADIISIAALKYTILRTQAGKPINFDPEKSLSFEGDSGPYLQYTYARCRSILNKAKAMNLKVSTDLPEDWSTLDLERYLYRFPEIVELSFKELFPHHVVGFITEITQQFNSWYGQGKILDESNPQSGYKLAVVAATAQVIKNGLWILGIEAPEKM